ncbi:hypothetical protein U9M48_041553 [Paspalum notatum var. saurae]|uniref:Reverse transcriptase domain-containing protein n=1 Tax=Paspalum notatum var. saurae TaxID=547442 RepID=A0AAQ3UQQ1_PASNO
MSGGRSQTCLYNDSLSFLIKGQVLDYTESASFIKSIDLSYNSGNIPYEIGNLQSLESLDLSDNQLSGRIPSGNQLDTLMADDPASMYIGNPGLCGHPLPKTIDQLVVIELPLLDCLYTWSNNRTNPILARLDRAFINLPFSDAFPSTSLTSRIRPTSDHKTLVVTIQTSVPRSHMFRFENAWLKHPRFLDSVLPSWHGQHQRGDAAARLADGLKAVCGAARLRARHNRASPSTIPNCKFIILLLDVLEEGRSLSHSEFQVRELAWERLARAIRERAAYLKQRSKHRAIRKANANTAFHHAYATQHRRRNQIHSMEVAGELLSEHNEISTAVTGYYHSIMGSASTPTWQFDLGLLYSQHPPVELNLEQAFTEAEALEAVRAMYCNSAPGPDGFGPSFYKAAWATVKGEVMGMLAGFHSGEVQLEQINRSYMILLPKKPGAVKVENFRPICLQNCSVKVASKILTTLLQRVIPKLIDLDQTGFFKGRSISENFVYALELVQQCHKRKVPRSY